ncbi:hypothetical protein LUZ63_012192 [Rhynchospora breviuscula]|uniref:Uncharacterized protein n=1 Tax=Rhynchospora breviuscula TaxID=2022672 RepID=A0A9Q0CL80_9POAL|nr:hypothetical protein LUZ63_012192 [Rhynchospora breviuscula]
MWFAIYIKHVLRVINLVPIPQTKITHKNTILRKGEMAEFVVNYVLGRIADTAYAEALSLLGVREKVERVKRDLKWVSAFLKDADAKRNKDARVKQWAEEVKEVAYMIEDVLDEYFVEMGGGRSMSCLKKIGHFPKELIARHKLASEIDEIKERMKEIEENTKKFGISEAESGSRDRPPQLARPVENPDIGKVEVIGFEDDFNNVCRQLFDQSVSRRSVISIVGPGGRGKTTLAKKIYKSAEEKHHFNCLIWVTISKEFEIVGILKKMLRKLREISKNEEKRDEEHFLTELCMSLRNKKYLIVLDDVWSTENRSESPWARLENALPNDDNGSRVLITTRFINVATESDATNKPYQLRILSEDESRQLLLKKIFPNQFAKECPVDLFPLINQFAKKCDGWPLALVVLGGILSTKDPNYNTWNDLKMDWQIEGHECLDIISTSYEDLPSYLKPCFMYIASFPEDYKIKASYLTRLWIAEGFIIHHDPTRATEEIAQSYLEELVQRCMVQVSERSWSGRIKHCYVHDILRELAIGKAKEENFFLIFSKSDANSTSGSSTSARRIAFHEFGNTELPKKSIIGPKLRSLISFGDNFANFQKLRMVKVIYAENSESDENFYLMEQLTTLRFQAQYDKPVSYLLLSTLKIFEGDEEARLGSLPSPYPKGYFLSVLLRRHHPRNEAYKYPTGRKLLWSIGKKN